MSDREPDPRGRHELKQSIFIGSNSGWRVPSPDGEIRHISGEVSIDLSGATPTDRPHTQSLLEEIESAVMDAIENFEGDNDD